MDENSADGAKMERKAQINSRISWGDVDYSHLLCPSVEDTLMPVDESSMTA